MADMLMSMPLKKGRRFRHRGKSYRLNQSEIRTLELLREVATNPALQSTSGLLAIRPLIRDALLMPCPIVVCYVVDQTSDPRVLRLATWMLGRMGFHYATPSVARLTSSLSFRVRREAVRGLRRLHAWSLLRKVATEHEDPRTRLIAQPKRSPAYDDRLAGFVATRRELPIRPNERTLHLKPGIASKGRPPKPPWRIARVLRRIHRLVQHTRRRPSRWLGILTRYCHGVRRAR